MRYFIGLMTISWTKISRTPKCQILEYRMPIYQNVNILNRVRAGRYYKILRFGIRDIFDSIYQCFHICCLIYRCFIAFQDIFVQGIFVQNICVWWIAIEPFYNLTNHTGLTKILPTYIDQVTKSSSYAGPKMKRLLQYYD
jgi:hypothetical protein